jgi:hypothetical protein
MLVLSSLQCRWSKRLEVRQLVKGGVLESYPAVAAMPSGHWALDWGHFGRVGKHETVIIRLYVVIEMDNLGVIAWMMCSAYEIT